MGADVEALGAQIDLFDRIRAVYLDAFAHHLARIPQEIDFAIEAELVSQHGLPVREGLLQAGLRLDVVQFENGRAMQNQRIGSARFVGFAPFRAHHAEIDVTVSPFTWDMVQITAETRAVPPNWLPVRRWLETHFRESEDTGTIFSDCVHFLSDPEPVDGGFALEADLGSAPPCVLPALVEALASCGMTEVSIGGAT